MTAQTGFGDLLARDLVATVPSARHRGARHALVEWDCLSALGRMPSESVDMVFSDPPYFLSNGGSTCSAGKMVPVHKGEWDRSNGVDADHAFHSAWLAAVRRVLKPSGTLWVSGTHHNLFSVGYAMQLQGWHVLNLVSVFKPNAAPNLACAMFTHSVEQVIWAAPTRYEPSLYTFNDDEMRARYGDGKQVRDMWTIPVTPARERLHGDHPCQKPLELLRRCVAASTTPGQLVLDPFCGSGTTGLAALEAGCRFIGVDVDPMYLDLTQRRIDGLKGEPA